MLLVITMLGWFSRFEFFLFKTPVRINTQFFLTLKHAHTYNEEEKYCSLGFDRNFLNERNDKQSQLGISSYWAILI